MNKEKRSELNTAIELLCRVLDSVSKIRDKEQDCLDNMPENLEGSEKYSTIESAVESLDDAIEKIEEAIEHIGDAIK